MADTHESPVKFNEVDALDYDWFGGDHGDTWGRELRDDIVTSRGTSRCGCCCRQEQRGERVRVITKTYVDDGIKTYRFCSLCCAAASIQCEDGGAALSARIKIGDDRIREEANDG